MMCLNLKVITGKLNYLDELAELFNQYRIFYSQENDINLAKKFIKQRLENVDSVFFICIEEKINKLIGFIQIYPTFSSISCQKDYILNDLFVLPEYRGQGVATLILENTKRFVIENNGKGLSLETAKNNPAKKLYEKLGWYTDEEFIHYYWKKNDNIKVMSKFVDKLKGYGVIALQDIKKGEIVLRGKSQYIVTKRDYKNLQIDDDIYARLDVPFENTNHSCNANSGVKNNIFDGYDLIALRNIKKGEEITMDYCMTEWESLLGECNCGSENCRQFISGAKDLSVDFINQYEGYVSDYIKFKLNGKK